VADFVIGQPDFTSNNQSCAWTGKIPSAGNYCGVSDIAVDARGDVYVSDNYDNRILEYSAPLGSHPTADRVFGQHGFSGSNCNAGTAPGDLAGIGPDSLCYFGVVPGLGLAGLAVDSKLNVYASDVSNSRLLVYNNPSGAPVPETTPTATPVTAGSASPTATPGATPSPTPIATAIPGHPFISRISDPILVGARFSINGTGFTPGAVVNFFVSTASGPINTGPLTPVGNSSTGLNVAVPADNIIGQGFVAVEVVNTDRGYATSNMATALLQGSAAVGIPSLTTINGAGLAPTSADPRFAADNVETVVVPGSLLSLGGSGFDVTNGIAVDVFCACAGGKVGPFMLGPGNPGLHPALIRFTLPPTGPDAPPIGPSAIVVSNKGTAGTYSMKSNAVAVPIGAAISVSSVSQSGDTVRVDGTGFSTLTVINFFNSQPDGVVNLGGLKPDGTPKLPLTIVNDTQFTFSVSSALVVPGLSYVQALNPPFVPFTSSGEDPGGAFTLK
jgi:hypothetical protein